MSGTFVPLKRKKRGGGGGSNREKTNFLTVKAGQKPSVSTNTETYYYYCHLWNVYSLYGIFTLLRQYDGKRKISPV